MRDLVIYARLHDAVHRGVERLTRSGQTELDHEANRGVSGRLCSATRSPGSERPMINRQPSVVVFSPSPLLTITVESGTNGSPEIHLHAGGQGFWVARMVASIGVPVVLCGPFGDDSGFVLRELIAAEGVGVASPRRQGGKRRLCT